MGFGALCYTVSQVAGFCSLAEEMKDYLVEWPLVVGGFLFFVGGFCELIINDVHKSLPTTLVWWVSSCNFIGGVTFWLSACPCVFAGDTAAYVGLFGDCMYMTAAILAMLMWRGEQFGGAIIPALNKIQRDDCSLRVQVDASTGVSHIVASRPAEPGGRLDARDGALLEDVLNPKLSVRSIIFIQVFVLIGFVQEVVCCLCMHVLCEQEGYSAIFRRHLNVFLTSFTNVVMVHMILVVYAACVTVPNEEPYRTLFIMVRFASIIVLANTVLTVQVVWENETANVV